MSKFQHVGYDEAHQIVDSNKSLFWDGWNIVEWRKDSDGFFSKNGMYKNNSWGKVIRIVSLDNDGTWKVPAKYAMGR